MDELRASSKYHNRHDGNIQNAKSPFLGQNPKGKSQGYVAPMHMGHAAFMPPLVNAQ
ncbi:MAG: hypothetical protein M0Q47_02055 [Methanothrix sp.]|jgi:hypothetical protein|nr:hypothetical protein [Methanothrix sp.]MCK9405186.1 hypothetical protein [Methanothrix sp.]